MGGVPYRYVVAFESDTQAALDKLRADVFARGDFFRSELAPATPEEALMNGAETGTRSILDISTVTEQPDYCCAAPLTDSEMERYWGTTQPTLAMTEEGWGFMDDIQRGMARVVTLWKDGAPDKLLFVGYSFD